MKRITCASLPFLIFFVALFCDDAEALPVFARKYKTTCVTCHAPFPKLSALGEAFRLNGYKLPKDDEIYVKQEPLSLGAEAYKKVWPESIWPSSLPGIPPVSFRVLGDLIGYPNNNKTPNPEFDFQNEVDIHAAGAMGDNLSFFLEVGITPSTASGSNGDSSVDAEGWIMWQSLFPSLIGDNHMNIKAGRLGKHEISLPNIRFDNTFQVDDYFYNTDLNLDTQPGFELNGFGRNWRYAVGVVEADTSNSEKDFYGNFALKFCGLGFDGSGAGSSEGGIGTTPAGYWVDNSILLGAFAYRSHVGPDAKIFDRIGGDLRVNYERLSVAAGYMKGKNHERDDTTTPPSPFNESIAMAEAHYFVYPWLIPYVRWERAWLEYPANQDKERFIFGTAMLVVANFRINLEGRLYTLNEPLNHDPDADDDRIAMRLDWAF